MWPGRKYSYSGQTTSKDLRGRGVLPQLERLMLTLSHGRYLVLSRSVRLVGALALSTTICERNLSTGTGAPGSLRSTSLTSRMVCPPADGYVWHRIKFSLVYSMLIHIACILLMDLVCSLRTLETIVEVVELLWLCILDTGSFNSSRGLR
jgi:hypothetical protein